MQGTNLYLIVFVVVVLMLPEEDGDTPVVLYALGLFIFVAAFFALAGGGTLLCEYLDA